jgi:hypothetical protein
MNVIIGAILAVLAVFVLIKVVGLIFKILAVLILVGLLYGGYLWLRNRTEGGGR